MMTCLFFFDLVNTCGVCDRKTYHLVSVLINRLCWNDWVRVTAAMGEDIV